MMKRLSWDEYFMNIAVQVSLRSTCIRRKVGALLVKNNTIVSTGYNGSPKGLPNCSDNPDRCYRSVHNIPSGEKLDLCYAVHAEVNALMNAIKSGANLEDSTVYVTTFPCSSCAKALIQAGVKRICYLDKYTNEFTLKMIREAGVECREMDSSIYRTPDTPQGNMITENDLDSIDPIVKEIYFSGFEPGSIGFETNRERVFEKYNLKEKYGDERVLCVDIKPEREFISDNVQLREILNKLSVEHITMKRYLCEYNGGEVKQVVVGTVLFNPVKMEIGILRCVSGRLKGKLTMIQGHVAVEDYRELFNIDNLLFKNLYKELDEEVGLTSELLKKGGINIELAGAIQSNDNKISSEHIGLLFLTTITNNYVWNTLTTHEPEKHEFIKVPIKGLKDSEEIKHMDTWLNKFVNYIL